MVNTQHPAMMASKINGHAPTQMQNRPAKPALPALPILVFSKCHMNRFLALVAFLFVTASCWADGFVMQATAVPAAVRIPGQRALIQFTNGVSGW